MSLSHENKRVTGWLVVIVVCLFVVAIGAQSYVALHDNAERDRQDALYADCLTEFAADLVATIEARSEASGRLERARTQKETRLDLLVAVIELARRNPPEANEARFQRVLERRIAAQTRYRELANEYAAVREANPYVSPKVVCER